MESTDDELELAGEAEADNKMLPPLAEKQNLTLVEMNATEKFTRAAARYTEASLVKKLEELGIGRPSTYAPTIATIQKRAYVLKEDREGKQRNYRVINLKDAVITQAQLVENVGVEKSKLFPSDIGAVVNDFLVQHFQHIVDFNFTAKVEKEFDDIAQGLTEWTKMIQDFYTPFHKDVENTMENAERANTNRDLGIDPVSGKLVSVRIGRFGPFVQLGEADEENNIKPKYASLRTGQMIETISLEEAMELFKLPKNVGLFEDKDVVIGIGKFGPYIRHNSIFTSIGKEDDPHTIELDRSIELILAKREKDANKIIKLFTENDLVKVLNGRWGPYIQYGKDNVKIPKDTEATTLTYADCVRLAGGKEAEDKPAYAKKGAKTATKKVASKKESTTKKAAPKKAAAKKSVAKKAAPKKAAAKKAAPKK
jgi:DNA topoisomerase-1